MLAYHVENRLTPPPLHQMRMHGKIAGQMETFFRERVLSAYAREVIYAETEEQFRLRLDDETPVGMWRGEFWGKWVISACRVCQYEKDESLKEFLRQAALRLIATADPNGYIGTYRDPLYCFPLDRKIGEQTVGWPCDWNWNIWCRKYTLWGLLECYLLTGDEAILHGAVRTTDQLLDMLEERHIRLCETGTFNGLPSCSILKPMLLLYRITENKRYLDFCLKIAADWERPDGHIPNLIANALSGRPLHAWYPRPQTWGKVYELLSCLDGLLELYRVTGTEKYLTTVSALHDLLKQYEGNTLFSVGFNDIFANGAALINSCSEPCDVIHWMRVNYELFALTGKAEYLDDFEKAFLNPFLAASFEDGKWGARAVRVLGRHMAVTGQSSMKYSHCCVNNMPRGYINACQAFVMTGNDGVYVNLYTPFEAALPQGSVRIGGAYLEEGRVELTLSLAQETTLHLRVPEWSRKTWVDGAAYEAPGAYISLHVPAGEKRITVQFDMHPRLREFPVEPARLPEEDFRVQRYVAGNQVNPALMIWDRRATVLYGPLLLARSKRVGSTEEEMFHSPTLCGKAQGVEITPIPARETRNAYRVRFHLPQGDREETLCDYATGGNCWSLEDDKLFNVYI